MGYVEFLHTELSLPRVNRSRPIVLDLFAGCGGLALGFEAAGFRTIGYEMLEDACQTYSKNLRGTCWQRYIKPDEPLDEVSNADVIIGGPPCQPFSVVGLQNGKHDDRDGFPAFLSLIQRYDPKLVLFENVRGMLYRNKGYFEAIADAISRQGYIVEWRVLNAMDYGVPQNRERLFVVGHRGIWRFPDSTLPQDHPFTAGEALREMAFSIPENAKFLTPSMDEYVSRYEKKSQCIRPRDLHLDQPSRTVTCRNLNGATGDMLRVRLPDGRRRRLTVREGARLQSFPDWFEFCGAEGSQFNQVGNAVPPLLAKAVADSVQAYLRSRKRFDPDEIRRRRPQRQLKLAFADN
ncbi:MAG: DNA (cytosine-5-)-methyltransferase [Planctomycetes bacterium RBG_13_60_9]|nr:MAG: DNA (cytosine-5-)-methyltransferase [Planctomycetes bacterium RBG_13_60_9]